MPGGGSRIPATVDSVVARLHYLRMDGKETFKAAVNAIHGARSSSDVAIDVAQMAALFHTKPIVALL
jgi:3-oxoacyl-[acyl-carrier-protein] synthase-3